MCWLPFLEQTLTLPWLAPLDAAQPGLLAVQRKLPPAEVPPRR
jgi:hypothetical protein